MFGIEQVEHRGRAGMDAAVFNQVSRSEVAAKDTCRPGSQVLDRDPGLRGRLEGVGNVVARRVVVCETRTRPSEVEIERVTPLRQLAERHSVDDRDMRKLLLRLVRELQDPLQVVIVLGVDRQGDVHVRRTERMLPVRWSIRSKVMQDGGACRHALFEFDRANDSPYGLGATVITRDIERGKRLARQIDSGMVFINEVTGTAPELPFGGVKNSGYGRELSHLGIGEFVNKKLIRVAA
jgi:Aldehyde dehydrogenase family